MNITERTSLILGPDGLIATYRNWDGNTKTSSTEVIDHSKEAMGFLFEEIAMSPDTTFKDLFSILKLNLESFSKVFYKDHFRDWINHIDNNPIEPDIKKEHIEIYWHVEETENYLNDQKMLAGINKPEACIRGFLKGRSELFSMMGMDLSGYMHLPIKLVRNFKIKHDSNGDYPEHWKDDSVKYEYERGFTLAQVIQGIFHEISFHGPSKKTKELFDKLEEGEEDGS